MFSATAMDQYTSIWNLLNDKASAVGVFSLQIDSISKGDEVGADIDCALLDGRMSQEIEMRGTDEDKQWAQAHEAA